jgi:hypothetical protein
MLASLICPLNRYLVRIEVPDGVYDARRIIDPPPVGWDAEPYDLPSVGLGDDRRTAASIINRPWNENPWDENLTEEA